MADDITTKKHWEAVLDKERRVHGKAFREEAKRAAEAARDDGTKKQAFNIQWSNCVITRGAVYAQRPKPDVRRRHQKPNPEEKDLARMVERGIEYNIDVNDFDSPADMVVKDFIECGLGVPRVVYDAETAPQEGVEPDEDGNFPEELVGQSVSIEHIPWKYFHWEPGKAWHAVTWIAFEAYLPREELEEEYGVEIKAGKDDESDQREADDELDEVQVYEIWHKPSRQVIVYCPTHPKLLEVRPDPLRLQHFWPCPRPMFANLKSEELIPKPDYCFIEKQITELNRITQRIENIVNVIRPNGYYDASMTELAGLLTAKDGTLKPVSGLASKMEGRLNEAISMIPTLNMAQTLVHLIEQREAAKHQIYEILGISDIVRGMSAASETATAQQLKGQWANVRLGNKVREVARCWRDTFRLIAEIFCEHFSPQILQMQTGVEISPGMWQIMKSDLGRSFAIDIETDSTIATDDYEERQQVMEMIDTILAKLEQVVPGIVEGILPIEFVQETLLMVVQRHKHGKQLEDAIMGLEAHWQSFQQFQQQMQQAQQQIMQMGQQLEQAGGEVQNLRGALEKVNMREEGRKDAELKVKLTREAAEADAQRIENRLVIEEHGLSLVETQADIEKTDAETQKIIIETIRAAQEPQNPGVERNAQA